MKAFKKRMANVWLFEAFFETCMANVWLFGAFFEMRMANVRLFADFRSFAYGKRMAFKQKVISPKTLGTAKTINTLIAGFPYALFFIQEDSG